MSKEEICGNSEECIVLKVYLHCKNCSKSVVKCLNQFPGVEEVIADVKNDIITVKGKGVDPKSLAERLENKCNKHVHIIYPLLDNLCNDVKINQAPAIIDEVKVIQVVLNVYIHCQNCGNNFKARLLKMKGVRKVEVDKEKSQVKVEGRFEATKLVEYVDLRMGKQASIIVITFPGEEISEPVPNNDPVVEEEEEEENAPKMVKCNCCCWETFPPPQSHHFFHASEMLSDECTESCSIM